MIREIRVADCGADLQAAVRSWFDLVERQTVNVEDPGRGLDVQFHQVDERRSPSDEPHVCALLRGPCMAGRRDGCPSVRRSRKFKGFHSEPFRTCWIAAT